MKKYHVKGKLFDGGAFVSVGKFDTMEEIIIEEVGIKIQGTNIIDSIVYAVNGLVLSEYCITDAQTGEIIKEWKS